MIEKKRMELKVYFSFIDYNKFKNLKFFKKFMNVKLQKQEIDKQLFLEKNKKNVVNY
jgi:hypothetical protein